MNYLHAGILGWMALASVPVILHWLLRERIRRLTYGGTRFLGTVALLATARKQWLETLLMIIRTALVVLLVAAFARPYLTNALGVHPLTVLVVDCSRSMVPGGRFDRAQAAALNVLTHLPSGERVLLAGVGDLSGSSLVQASDVADATRRLAALHPGGDGVEDLVTALDTAVTQCRNQPGAIHLFSALAAANFPSSGRAATIPESCHLVIHDVALPGDLPPASVSLSAELESHELTPGPLNLAVAARLSNRGPARTAQVRLLAAGQVLDQQRVALPQDGSAAVALHGTLLSVGEIPLTVEAVDVPTILPDDNRSRLIANVVQQIQVAIVDGNPQSDHSRDPAFFIRAALTAGAGSSTAITLLTATPPLDAYHVVVLAGPRQIDPEDARRLNAFVGAGGGLLTVLAPGFDPQVLNPGLASIAPIRVRTWHTGEVSLSAEPAGTTFFQRILSERGDDFSRARFSGSADLTDAVGCQVLLRFSDQRPALLSAVRGQGMSLLLATGLDRSVSDFPLRPLFLPFVQELVRALHTRVDQGLNLLTGTQVTLAPGDTLSGADGPCPTDPDGRQRVTTPGFYTLDHLQHRHQVAINGTPSASAGVALTPADIQRLFTTAADGVQATSHGLERVMAPDEMRQAEARLGFGHWCLILVGILLLVELLIAHAVSRR